MLAVRAVRDVAGGADAVQRPGPAGRRRAAARCCAKCDPVSTASCSSPSGPAPWCRCSSSRSSFARMSRPSWSTARRNAAARAVTTAQRLVEDYAALQQRGATALDAIDDQIMVLVRRAIDEDVNLFDRTRLQATSARDLFASQLLPPRTPSDVYRAILLDRLPTYVGRGAGRRAAVSARRGAGARQRTRGHRHGADDQPAAADRAADRRTRSAGAVRHRAVQPARRGARLLDGRADRRSGEPPDARDAPHRPRRSRRARRRDFVATNCGVWSRTSTRWPPTSSASGASSSARSGSRRGPTWRARWRTTSRTR